MRPTNSSGKALKDSVRSIFSSDTRARLLFERAFINNLPNIGVWTGLVCAAISLTSVRLGDEGRLLLYVNLLSAFLLCMAGVLCRKRNLSLQTAHVLFAAGFCITLANALLRISVNPDGRGIIFVAIILATASVVISWPMYLGLSLTAVAAASITWRFVEPSQLVAGLDVTTVGAALIGAVFFWMRMRNALRQSAERLNIQRRIDSLSRSVEAGKRTEVHYKQLITTLTGVGVVVHDAEGRVVLSNNIAKKYLRLDENAMDGASPQSSHFQFIHEDGRQMAVDEYPVTRVLVTRKPLYNYVMGTRIPGLEETNWALVNASPVLSPAGEIEQIVVTFVNLTKQKRAEQEISASQQRFKTLFEQAPDGYFLLGLDGVFIDGNRTAERLVGYERGELIGVNAIVSGVVPDDYLDVVADVLKSACAADAATLGEAHQIELVRKDGSRVPLEICAYLIQLDGKPVILGSARDQTERIETERKLNKSAEVLRETQRIAKLGGWEIDLKTGAAVWTDEVWEIFDLPRADGPDVRAMLACYHDADRNRLLRAVDASTNDLTPYDLELKITTAAGNHRWVRAVGHPQMDEDGKALRMWGTVQDITDLKATEIELRRLKEYAEAASRSKTNFLANMSHEIRTPLNGVLGMAELLLHTPLDPQQQEQVGTILRSGEALLSILNDILDLSRIEADKLETEDRAFDIHKLTREVGELLRPSAEKKDLTLTCACAPSVPTQLISDPLRVRQIILNLVGNAIKFTERGRVSLEVNVADSLTGDPELRIVVNDTGIGIPEDKLNSIFDAFSQADSSITRRFGGSGLGLTISKRMAGLLHGSIDVSSEIGKGTVFTLRLPLRVPAEGDKTPAHTASERRPFALPTLAAHTPRILLAEDNLTNRDVAQGLLKILGCGFVWAGDGEEAVARAQQEQFDLVLMDIHMPRLDGYEAARRIIKDQPNLPVVAMTAFAMKGDSQRCLDHGMKDYISKPMGLRELGAIIEKWCGESATKTPPAPKAELPESGGQDRSEIQTGVPLVLCIEDSDSIQRVNKMILKSMGWNSLLASDGRSGLAMLKQHMGSVSAVVLDVGLPDLDGFQVLDEIRAMRHDLPVILASGHGAGMIVPRLRNYERVRVLPKPYSVDGFTSLLREVVQPYSPAERIGA